MNWIISTASDVYDTAETNVKAGWNYSEQETPNNHVHDVAIRRAVLRCGRYFEGDHLVHVRWKDSEGFRLNPGVVPFHKPKMILEGELVNLSGKELWWYHGTIEDFYQRNKLLQARE